MCYSAQVKQHQRKLARQFNARSDYGQMELLFSRRARGERIAISRAFEDNFADPENDEERRIKALIDEFRAHQETDWQQELFAQKKRLADAQRKLAENETKAARESERIAGKKIEALADRLADLARTEPKPRDSRIYPFNYAPIVIREGGENKIVLARYHCRGQGKDEAIDRKFPGLYNARRDNLEKFWRGEFGRTHAVCVIDAFFENVERDGKNAVLQFVPKPAKEMIVACLYARWTPTGGGPELLSFAAITDEPPAEVSAAGHDRCIVNLKPEHVETWLAPQGKSAEEMQAIIGDVERPYYEHRVLAA